MVNTGGEETEKSAENGTTKRPKPPFQLCFASTHEQGRSEMSRPKLPRQTCLITPKFYSRIFTNYSADHQKINEVSEEIEKLRQEGPREKYSEPLLESHCYGWYPEPLIPLNKTDRLHNHHRMTSEMVKVQSILHNASRAEKEFEQVFRKVKQD